MNKKELKLILEEGEGYKIEFKESVSNIDREIVSFANSSGGRIFLGITDDGKLKGVNISNRLKSQIQDIANNCRPKIQISFREFQNILIVDIREGEDKPYECSAGFFKRLGPNTQKMTRDEIINCFKSEGKVRFDELIEVRFKYPQDFDVSKLSSFMELAGISKTARINDVLLNLGIAEKRERKLYLNNAGLLFFANDPQHFSPWSVFTVVLFKDKNGVYIIDRKELSGGLFQIVNNVMDFVHLYTKIAYKFTGKPQREEIYEYPFEAVREAIINSVMHKDYFEHGHNNILKFFPDRIQIENVWTKPKRFILGKTIFRRNHIIADLFSRIHFGEKLGSGMKRMRAICEKENAPHPKIEYTDTHFYITFRQSRAYLQMAESEGEKRKTETKKLGVKLGVRLGVNEKKILARIAEDKFITIIELSRKLGISTTSVENNLAKLKKKRLIQRMGSDKTGYWEIIDK